MSDQSESQSDTEKLVRVLVVDDLETLVKILKHGLTQMGFEVYSAMTGKEGLEAFRAGIVDVIVCDLSMEPMDGREVGRAVKKACEEEGRPKTPFILLTGHGSEADVLEDPAADGIDRIMEKPVDLSELSGTIRRLVKRSTVNVRPKAAETN
jgi:CheY-like chemotaxis protein